MEEHVTILKEPDSQFIGYASPTEATREEIHKAIMVVLSVKKYSLNYLGAIGCDGTAPNTEHKTGENTCIERHLQRSLQ